LKVQGPRLEVTGKGSHQPMASSRVSYLYRNEGMREGKEHGAEGMEHKKMITQKFNRYVHRPQFFFFLKYELDIA